MNQFKITPSKTYATKANVEKAVAKSARCCDLRYFITCSDDGRFYPVFIGQPALERQAFVEFCVVA
jgi:hypothetical protein